MSYNSVQFMLFFAGYLLLFFAAPGKRMKQVVILMGSLVFYRFAGGINLLSIVILQSLCVYTASRLMEKIYAPYELQYSLMPPKERTRQLSTYKKKTIMVLLAALAVMLGILVYVKMGGLFDWEKVGKIRQFSFFRTYLAPLGLSYYTFSSIGYLLDVYWRKTPAEHNYFKLLMCMVYFPHIVQGPISKYSRLVNEFDNIPRFSFERLCFGLERMLYGLLKKMVIADRIALYTAGIYSSPSSYSGSEIIFAVILGVFQLYCDFSGCMDIVIGASETTGISLEENFRRPFFSKSASEFWRRWHITLGAWFKDYVYMPIAVNARFIRFTGVIRKKFGARAGQVMSAAVPSLVVWILTGLWHGTGPDYVVWGLYWGVLIVLETIFSKSRKKLHARLNIGEDSADLKLVRMAETFLFFCVGRMLTVTGSLGGFRAMVRQIVKDFQWNALLSGVLWSHNLTRNDLTIILMSLAAVWVVEILQERGIKIRESLSEQSVVVRWILLYAMVFMVVYLGIYGISYSTSGFAYAQF